MGCGSDVLGRCRPTSEAHVPPGLTGVRNAAIWSAFAGVSSSGRQYVTEPTRYPV
jgi:hypothetical protein